MYRSYLGSISGLLIIAICLPGCFSSGYTSSGFRTSKGWISVGKNRVPSDETLAMATDWMQAYKTLTRETYQNTPGARATLEHPVVSGLFEQQQGDRLRDDKEKIAKKRSGIERSLRKNLKLTVTLRYVGTNAIDQVKPENWKFILIYTDGKQEVLEPVSMGAAEYVVNPGSYYSGVYIRPSTTWSQSCTVQSKNAFPKSGKIVLQLIPRTIRIPKPIEFKWLFGVSKP